MLRLFAALVFSLFAFQAFARCEGVDLRDHLDPAQSAALAREVRQMPYPEGNHWIARKGAREIHIIGTMHVNDPRLGAVMRNITPVIRSADAVLLEVTGREGRRFWEAPEENLGLFVIKNGQTLPDVMSKAGWEALVRAARQINLDPARTARIQPWFLSILLAESFCGPTGFFPQNGLDNRIEAVAIRARVPIGSLETVESAIALLSRRSLADQARMLEYDLTSAKGNDNTFVTLRETYFDQKMATGMVMEKWQFLARARGSQRERQRLWANYTADILDTRNRAWVPQIQRTKGNKLVVAIGAAHLPGRNGVLSLLQRAGYRLERAAF